MYEDQKFRNIFYLRLGVERRPRVFAGDAARWWGGVKDARRDDGRRLGRLGSGDRARRVAVSVEELFL